MAKIHTPLVGAYPEYNQESTGGTAYPTFPTVNDPPFQSNPVHNAELGDFLIDKYGNQFVYVRSVAALAQGQVCTYAANLVGTVSAGTTTAVINTNVTTTINEASVGSFLADGGASGIVFLKLIKAQTAIGANTQFTISKLSIFLGTGKQDGDVLGSTPTTGDAAHVIRLFGVDVAGAVGVPVGVALGTVTSGNRTIIQVAGLAQVLSVGSTDALVDNRIVVTAAAGVVKSRLTAGSTADDATSVVGVAKMAYAGASKLQPIMLGNLALMW